MVEGAASKGGGVDLARRFQLEARDACGHVHAGSGFTAERLQCEVLRISAHQGICPEADTDGSTGRGADIGAGKSAIAKGNGRRGLRR